MNKAQKIFIMTIILCLVFVTGCGAEEKSEDPGEPLSKDIFAMDTYMTLTAYGEAAEDALNQAEAEIYRIDALLSTGNPESEISKLNKEKHLAVSEETFNLIKRACEMGEDTKGIFDITIYPIMGAWGFTDGNYRVPDEKELKDLLKRVDYSKVVLNEEDLTVTLEDDMEIDLGGIAKGYTSDRIEELMKNCGVEHGLINLGGNVQVIGNKPDGSDWKVAVIDPQDQEYYVGIVAVSDKAVITSGGYQRYFEQDGKTYIHIIDTSDGYPAANGLLSTTVVSDDGTLADALSTSLFVMGPEKAVDYWRANSDKFDMVLVKDDGTLLVTEGLDGRFNTECEYEFVS
ncbi:MAG: FAD:protein FMN transferase [Firmicutes bacterium]|nr:FAD:protein FMN transferase [Bacillota bacterium]MBQ6089580.1 FAD:protein FMN transferase [Bacillota bacterium]